MKRSSKHDSRKKTKHGVNTQGKEKRFRARFGHLSRTFPAPVALICSGKGALKVCEMCPKGGKYLLSALYWFVSDPGVFPGVSKNGQRMVQK
jgi:hypothetical protein